MPHNALKNRVFTWFLLTVGILSIISALMAVGFYKFKQQQDLVEHTYKVINYLQDTVSNVKDIQSSQRGYVITGQEDYLGPYAISLPKIDEDLIALEVLVADNPVQSERLKILKQKIIARIDFAGSVIEAYRKHGQDAAFTLVRSGTGKREMDEIRNSIGEMIDHEQKLLIIRAQRTNEALILTATMGFIGLLTCISILYFVFFIVRREMKHRARVEEELGQNLAQMQEISQESILINKLGDFLQSCRTLDEAFSMLGQHIPHLLPNSYGNVALLNNSHNFLEAVSSWGNDTEMVREFEPDQCWCMRRGAIHHVRKDGADPVCQHVKFIPEGGYMCVPMLAHGETVGMLFVGAKNTATLSERKQQVIRTLSEQISLAVSNLRLQDRLRQQSVRDPLTQLFNRRYLQETLEREISRAKRYKQEMCVLVIDVDHFKKFNDTYGHDAGDALLVNFANLLRNNVRTEDIVCRYGGEEFVVVLPSTTQENGLTRANILCEMTRKMVVTHNKQSIGKITISIGMSVFPQHAQSPDGLITSADTALYQAKQSGRDQVMIST